MKFDDFLLTIGEFGLYQRRLYVLLSLPAIHNAVTTSLMVVFLFAMPDHRCIIPDLRNDTYEVQSEAHANLINLTIPMVSGNHGDLKYSSCEIYSSNNSADFRNETEECSSWVYDKQVFISTMAETMNFVCEKKSYQTHAKVLIMIGHLIGVLISGPLSDIFGRRAMVLAGMFTAVVTCISLSWVNNLNLLIPTTILLNAGYNTVYLSSFVYNMEMVGPSKRTYIGVAMNLFWSAGVMTVALVAFLLRDWKVRQLVVALPGILFVYLYFVPESPRWLLCKGRKEEAHRTLKKMADTNKVVVSPDDLESVKGVDESKKEPFWKLLRSPTMLGRLCIICYNWFAIGAGFFGLSMNVTNLSGDIYLNFFLFALLEACAYAVCLFLLGRIRRKLMLCSAMLLAGVTCILSFVPVLVSDRPEKWIVNSLACLGNTFVSAGFAIVYVFSAELLPTSSRNFGMGISSLVCRIGSLVSPYINDLTLHVTGRYSQVLPMLIFGGITGLAGLLALLLPETQNKRLPETIQDAERLGKKGYLGETENVQQEEMLDTGSLLDDNKTNLEKLRNNEYM